MRRTKPHATKSETLITAALRGELIQTQARRLYQLGSEVVTMAVLAAAKHIAEQNRGQVP